MEGKILEGNKTPTYTEAAYRTKETDIDGAVTNGFVREVIWHKGGFGRTVGRFPLTEDRRAVRVCLCASACGMRRK